MTISVVLHALIGARIMFFGDAHFDRGVRDATAKRPVAKLFISTQGLRDSSDFSLLNLETPLCEPSVPAVKKPISLRSDPEVATTLRDAGFTHAILANNHSMDRGLAGLGRTIALLERSGIRPVGASTRGDPCAPVMAKTKTDSVALLAIAILPGIDTRHVCADTARLRHHLAALARSGVPALVSLHWGTEQSRAVSRAQHELADRLAAWGASALVGHHAHVVQSTHGQIPSILQGKPVWYGIGNFVFDQHEPWTRRALAVQITTNSGKAISWKSIELVRDGPWVRVAKP